jgi:hypothetical protein
MLCIFAQTQVYAQLGSLLDDAKKQAQSLTQGKGAGLSKEDITNGLKEALNVGTKNATGKVSVKDGFFGNSLLKILMPPETKNVESKVRAIGEGDKVDQAILTMNRGAEDASQKALPIFSDAIKNITIEDGLSILNGNKDAATQYLKNKTTQDLYNAFLPIIKKSLDKVEATKYWGDVFKVYDEIPFVTKVNSNLPDYVTKKALDGLFLVIADEEAKIRANPEARVSDLLKKVFGNR